MTNYAGESLEPNTDYFANGLLAKLDQADPIAAAYEAQAVSHDVGFDFADFQDVVPRALDEVRETKEAFSEEGLEGHEHFGDEIADIMFSLVNLARHAGIDELPSLEDIVEAVDETGEQATDTLSVVDSIGARITEVAQLETDEPELFIGEMRKLLSEGLKSCSQLAFANEFQPENLLRENVRKYLVRCQAIEQLALEDGKQWVDLAANDEIVTYWKRAKVLLK